MPVNGNSYNIGRNYDGPNDLVAALDTERSRKAFQQRVKMREARAMELKDYCYRYIYRWTLQEKLSLINSYGEINRVRDRSNVNEVDNQLVETLLINLTESELNQVIANVNAQTQELKQKMKSFSKNADARSKQKLAQDFYEMARPGASAPGGRSMGVGGQNLGRDMQKKDLSFKANKSSVKMMPGLNKELDLYFKSLSLREIIPIARKLKIDFDNETTKSKLVEEIKYVINIYLSAISGKSKNVGPVPVDEDSIKEVERLVGYTSSAWMVGKPVLSPKSLKLMREKAVKAKAELEARQKVLAAETKKKTFKSKEFSKLAGGISGKEKNVAKALELNDNGFLKDYDFDELMSKAYELGLDPDPRKSTVGEIKAAIYAKLAASLKDRKKMEQDLAKAKAKDAKDIAAGKLRAGAKSSATAELEKSINAHKELTGESGKLQNKATALAGMESITAEGGGIPLVEFKEGKIVTRNVTKAIPVFIVGNQMASELYEQGKKEAELKAKEKKDDDAIAGLSMMEKIMNAADKHENDLNKEDGKKGKVGKKEKKTFNAIKKEEEKTLKKFNKISTGIQKDFLKQAKSFKKDGRQEFQQKVEDFEKSYSQTLASIKEVANMTETNSDYKNIYANILEEFSNKHSGSYTKDSKIADPTSTKSKLIDKLMNGSLGKKLKEKGIDISLLKGKSLRELANPKKLIEDLKNGEGSQGEGDNPSGEGESGGSLFSSNVKDLIKNAKFNTETVQAVYVINDFFKKEEETSESEDDSTKENDDKKSKKKPKKLLDPSKYRQGKREMSDEKSDLAHLKLHGIGKNTRILSDYAGGYKYGGIGEKEKEDGNVVKYFNTAAKRLLKNAVLDQEKVLPVFITNGFTEYLNNQIYDGFTAVTASNSAIYDYLSNVFPILFAGLQQAGTSFNLASATSTASKIVDLIQQGVNASIVALVSNDKGSIYKYATGGTGSAAGSKTASSMTSASISQFITGDSKTTRPNPELVTVDWENRNFAVKPATNDGNTVTNQSQMNIKERGSAFKVSFAEATIKYQKTNEGETTDNVALKVYPVTPGLTDKIDINGTPMSVIDLMSGMYLSLTSIETLIGTNVEISKVIAANTTGGGHSVQLESSSSAESFPTNLDSILRGE